MASQSVIPSMPEKVSSIHTTHKTKYASFPLGIVALFTTDKPPPNIQDGLVMVHPTYTKYSANQQSDQQQS
eukprot:11681137-Ditylum_brightwellii.AAC.1